MIRLNQMLVTISLLALVGCNNAEQSSTQTSPAASSASTEETAKPTTSGFEGLLGVVSNTKVAVEAKDFAKAKQEFEKFEDIWKTVEDGVKKKSPDRYKEIEKSLDEVTGELKGSKPNSEKVLTGLQSLNKNITGVAKP